MKVILRFVNQNDLSQENKFHVSINDMDNPDVQDVRIERLGEAQASLMSARTRKPYMFSGYELPDLNIQIQVEAWTWRELVADTYDGICED
jgi:hypothetical protein